MPNWKETNIDAQTLAALVVGLVAFTATLVSFFNWVDDRIDNRVADVEVELREFKVEVRGALNSSDASRNRQYGEILSKFDELLESRR